ncbi:MAG: glycosyltransferase, partial [Deltaproteobacteria bacterium]|nr:glycosyltransferase [Deltaproteobacteria bacterium]
EARNIRSCLGALLVQDHPALEILVIDDRSEDGTGELAAQIGGARVRVLPGQGPPPGWAGKPAACQLGAGEASGAWLLFLDADVQLSPWAVRRALALARARRLDLLSLWGSWTLHGFWEKVLIPAIGGFVRATQPLEQINDASRPEAFANGQFLLFRAEAYRELDGHAAVKGEVLEDVALGRTVKRRGRRLGMLLAPQAFRVRQYEGFAEVWQGFAKNIYAGMNHRPGLALLAVGLVGWMHLGPFVAIAAAATRSSIPLLLGGLFALASAIAIRWLDDRAAGRSPFHALTHPLGNAVLTGIILDSALRHHLGLSVRWKGRKVKP